MFMPEESRGRNPSWIRTFGDFVCPCVRVRKCVCMVSESGRNEYATFPPVVLCSESTHHGQVLEVVVIQFVAGFYGCTGKMMDDKLNLCRGSEGEL